MKEWIYLDDIRTPVDTRWIVVRSYDEFTKKIKEIGLNNIEQISLDHDLGDTAQEEYFTNTINNYSIDYNNIREKTGYDCAKWLIDHFYELNPGVQNLTSFEKKLNPIIFPLVYTHSANPIGSANIIGYINNFLKNNRVEQTCIRVKINHT
jgi:hypothetical protein